MRLRSRKYIGYIFFHLATSWAVAAPGDRDVSFDIGTGFDGAVRSIEVQTDGKILVGGDFRNLDGEEASFLVRLEADGSRDGGFQATVNASVNVIRVLSNGQILVGGNFSQVNGEAHARVVRLNANGTIDASFDTGEGPNSNVEEILPIDDGGLVIAGHFSRFDGMTVPRIIKLTADGSMDSGFTPPNFETPVVELATDEDERLWLGGSFTAAGTTPLPRTARLLPGGPLDESYQTGEGPNSTIQDILPLPGGGAFLAGDFSRYNNVGQPGLVRVLPDGLLDPSYQAGLNSTVNSLLQAEDESLFIGGQFTRVQGVDRRYLARLLPDGTLDPTFVTPEGTNGAVLALAMGADGRLLAGGNLTMYGGDSVGRMVRVDVAPDPNLAVLELATGTFVVDESASEISVEVRRRGNTGNAVSVNYATANGTVTVADYTPQNGTLDFAAGETSETFAIPITDDAVLENDETILLMLASPTAEAVLGGHANGRVVIVDDDAPAGAGLVDGTFPSEGADGDINAMAQLPDGKVLVAGNFGVINNTNRNRIARLNADGSVDPTFLPSLFVNQPVQSVAIQEDGKILIGGDFTVVNHVDRARIARLNADGTLDVNFTPGAGFNATVNVMEVDANGAILAGGAFTRFNNLDRRYIARLLADGSLDPAFNVGDGPQNSVVALLVQPDGPIVIGGNFTEISGVPRNRVARLLPNGSLDASFHPGEGPNGPVYSLGLVEDDKILMGGAFSQVNGVGTRALIRLLPNGIVDPAFQPPAVNGDVQDLYLDEEGRYVIGGSFSRVGGLEQYNVARFYSDGLLDPFFPMATNIDRRINAILPQPENKLLIGGQFTQIGELARPALARLQIAPVASASYVSFPAARLRVGENEGSLMIEVLRLGDASAAASVDYLTTSGTADVFDYEVQVGTLNFAAGETSKSFAIPILDDEEVEGNETFTVGLSIPNGVQIGPRAEATVEIVNDDASDAPGALNATYIGLGSNGVIQDSRLLANGKLVVVGNFSVIAGENRNRIAILTPDGELDPEFPPHVHANQTIHSVAEQADGKLLLGGDFTIFNGAAHNRLVRLRPEGLLDPTFGTESGFNSTVSEIAVTASNRILVAGAFTRYKGEPANYIARLLPDGTLDPTFMTGDGPNNQVLAMTLIPDGRIYIGGSFTLYNGVGRNRLARLLENGSLDTAFDPGDGPNSNVRTIALQADNRIVIGGDFSMYGETLVRYLARITPSGLVDPALVLDPPLNGSVHAIVEQEDGAILAGGDFTRIGAETHGHLIRLRANGRLDSFFDLGDGFDGRVMTLTLLEGEALFVGGQFGTLDGVSTPNMTVLSAQPSVDPGGGVRIVSISRSGTTVRLLARAPIGRALLVESSFVLQDDWQEEMEVTVPVELFEVVLMNQTDPEKYYRLASP